MALRQYQTDLYEYSPKENLTRYHTYKTPNRRLQQAREILFFLRVSWFGVLSVGATYVYLSLQISSVLAVLLGMATGLSLLLLLHVSLKMYLKKRFKKKRLGQMS